MTEHSGFWMEARLECRQLSKRHHSDSEDDRSKKASRNERKQITALKKELAELKSNLRTCDSRKEPPVVKRREDIDRPEKRGPPQTCSRCRMESFGEVQTSRREDLQVLELVFWVQ